MADLKIYHNPRCSKSRQALEILDGVVDEFTVVKYLESPPSVDELKTICARLGVAPIDIIRTSEKRFKELGLSKDDDRSDEEWFELIFDHPVLLQRPIVTTKDKAVVGRPPEKIKEILE